MNKQSQGSMVLVGAISGGIGFVAFVALMVLGGYTVSPAVFLAIVVAAAAAIFLFSGFHGTGSAPVDAAPDRSSLTPSADGQLGDVTKASGSAGVQPGSAGVEPGSAGVKVKTGTLLAGEQELAERKGNWRYEKAGDTASEVAGVANAGGADQSGTPFEVTEPAEADGTPASTPVPTTEADNTAIVGTEPTRLDAPRGDGADDLTRIKGVGPKLADMLHGMGIYHFDQIAGWTDQELAWVDENLEGFKGRASRDEWVSQAKILADGGETEFSKKSDADNGAA